MICLMKAATVFSEASNCQVPVYLMSGVQLPVCPIDNSATVTRKNMLNVCAKYIVPTTNV
jgi:hypothetical protein